MREEKYFNDMNEESPFFLIWLKQKEKLPRKKMFYKRKIAHDIFKILKFDIKLTGFGNESLIVRPISSQNLTST